MFTLAHISDPHIGPLPDIRLDELMSKRITGYVNWQRNRSKHLFGNTLDLMIDALKACRPNHLALTGDIVNLAARLEIPAARVWLDALANPLDCSVVPGNHDAYVPGALGHVIQSWRPFMTGDEQPASLTSAEAIFPYLRRRGPVAIIGVSTATPSPPFMASGYFGRRQARRLAGHLLTARREGLFRVVLIHHPPIRGAAPNYKRMIGIRRFAAVMRMCGAELVLHGHTHVNSVHWLAGADGTVPVCGIASASQGHGGKRPPSAFSLFDIGGQAGGWQLMRRRFELNGAATGFNLVQTDDVSALARAVQAPGSGPGLR